MEPFVRIKYKKRERGFCKRILVCTERWFSPYERPQFIFSGLACVAIAGGGL